MQRADIRGYNSEFVAAYARQDRAGAHNLGDTPGKLLESQVSDRVTIGVVDRFKPVKIEHKNRCTRSVGGLGQTFVELLDEKATVRETRQRIVSCQPECIQFGELALPHCLGQILHSAVAED